MILYEIFDTEDHPVYQELEIANGSRQYDFLRSAVLTTMAVNRLFLSSYLIKAFNFQAITCLHVNAGEYRPCPVEVVKTGEDGNRVVQHKPPDHYRVLALMDDFVNDVNRAWEKSDPVSLAAYVLWRLNWIHPFINGNGRTARAASYFVLCVKLNQWLPGSTILPELLRRERGRYVDALHQLDASAVNGNLQLGPLANLMTELLAEQLGIDPVTGAPVAPQAADAPTAGQVIALPGPPSAA